MTNDSDDRTRDPSQNPPESDQTTHTSYTQSSEQERIGPYRILEQIGAGGMGEVYRADQTQPIRRTVALKIIKRGMDTKEVITRFEAERQALALMDHPSIAKVFDAGYTPRGRPYFAMEYVRGVPITTYCDKQKLTIRERLEIFIQLCEGVQHAHQKAIIHRDLKPSNVLVAIQEDKPVPKIIDFGVAKATSQKLTENTMYTALGEFIGTPEYMSPEQAEMTGEDIDTRTDVYALGVMLYELLVGALPFDAKELRKAGFARIVRIIREQDPPRPSTKVSTLGERMTNIAAARRSQPRKLTGQLQGDLDWITMRALEKNRTRRYASALELAADLRRHLRDEPVLAGPPSPVYRFRKFAKRHRVALSVAAVVVISVLGALVESNRQRLIAQAARDESEVVTQFMADMLASVSPLEAGHDVTMKQVLDAASANLQEQFGDRPRIEARLRQTIGETYRNLGDYGAAETNLTRAVALRSRLLGIDDPATLDSMEQLSRVYGVQARYMAADSLSTLVFERRKWLLGENALATLRSMTRLGSAKHRVGRSRQSESLLVESLRRHKSYVGDDHVQTLDTMIELAQVITDLGRWTEAAALERTVVDASVRTLGKDHPRTLKAMTQFAHSQRVLGQHAEAESLLTRVLRAGVRVFGPEHPVSLRTMRHLADVYSDLGKYTAAESLHSAAFEKQKLTYGDDYPGTLASMIDLAMARKNLGRYQEAVDMLEQGLEIGQRAVGGEHPQTLRCFRSLIALYLRMEKVDRSRNLGIEYLTMLKNRADRTAEPSDINSYAFSLLTCEPRELQNPHAALEYAHRANILTNSRNPDVVDTLALAYHRTGEGAKAVEMQTLAIDLLRQNGATVPEGFTERLAEYQAALTAEAR